MRTLKNLGFPQDTNIAEFPDGQIQNETTTLTGTPVVRELYGDIITNIYKIVRDAGISFNELEDGETNGYQLLSALKIFVNDLNDKRQILSVAGTDITAPFNFDNLPDEYVFIGQVSDALDLALSYSLLSGSGGAASYSVNLPASIEASSTVLIILNSAGTTILNISSALGGNTVLNTAFGTPISFNESDALYYYSDGVLFNDNPTSYTIQAAIQAFASNANIIILDVILFKGRLLCLTLDTVLTDYRVFSFLATDFNTVEGEVTITDTTGTDQFVYWYCDGSFIYLTNSDGSINNDALDYKVSKQDFNETTLTLTETSVITLNNLFEKTTNVFMDASNLYTFIEGNIYQYALSGGTRTNLGFFPTINGAVFKFNGDTYYSNGNVATKWAY